MAAKRPYRELGKLIDLTARQHDIKGAKAISEIVRERNNGKGPGRSGWQMILSGNNRPSDETMTLFAKSLPLSEKEKARLAWMFTFRGALAA